MATEPPPIPRDTPTIESRPESPLFSFQGHSGLSESGCMTGLKIVWRNPKPASRKRRWHELACDVGRRLYVVEELVAQGGQPRWAQSIALEMTTCKSVVAVARSASAAKAGIL